MKLITPESFVDPHFPYYLCIEFYFYFLEGLCVTLHIKENERLKDTISFEVLRVTVWKIQIHLLKNWFQFVHIMLIPRELTAEQVICVWYVHSGVHSARDGASATKVLFKSLKKRRMLKVDVEKKKVKTSTLSVSLKKSQRLLDQNIFFCGLI